MPHPPQPPHHHPLPPDKKPISPILDSLSYHQPPKNKNSKSFILALLLGTVFAVAVGFILHYFHISINVILPVLAPIWIGTITLFYSVNSKN